MGSVLLMMAFVTTVGPGSDLYHPPPQAHRGTWVADLSDTVPGLVINLVNRVIPGSISPRRIKFDAPSTLIVEDLLLTDPEGEGVVKVARIEATIKIAPLLAGNLVVERLRVTGPRFLLKQKNGELNLMRALVRKKSADNKEPPPDVDISFENVTVSEGDLVYTDGKNVTVNATGLAGTGSASIGVRNRSVLVEANQASAKTGIVKLAQMDLPFRGVSLSAQLANKTLILKNANGLILGAPFRGGGSVSISADPRLRLKGSAKVPAGTWPDRLAPPTFDLPDIFIDEARISGTGKAPLVFLDGHFGAFATLGYTVERGAFQAEVTKSDVVIHQARAEAMGGTLNVADGGRVHFEDRTGQLDVQFKDLLVRQLEQKTLTPPSQGRVSGRVLLDGPLDLASALSASLTFRARNVELAETTFAGTTSGNARLGILKERLNIYALHIDGADVDADVDGVVFTKKKRLGLNVKAAGKNLRRVRGDIPNDVELAQVTFAGQVEGAFDNPVVRGVAKCDRGEAYGVPLSLVQSDIVATKTRLDFSNATARVAGGPFTASGGVAFKGARTLDIAFSGSRMGLEKIEALKDDVRGRAALEGVVRGTMDAPEVVTTAVIHDLHVTDEPLGDVSAIARVERDRVVLNNVKVHGAVLDAESRLVTYAFGDEAVAGTLQVTRVDLEAVEALKSSEAKGFARGRLRVGGTRTALKAAGTFQLSGLEVSDVKLGAGPLQVWLRPDTANGENAYTVEAAAALVTEGARAEVRAAYRTKTTRTHAEVKLEQVDLSRYLPENPELPLVSAFVSGTVTAQGPAKALNYTANLRAPHVTFGPRMEGPVIGENGRAFSEEVAAYAGKGPVGLTAALIDGRLDALLCAFPETSFDADVGMPRVTPCADDAAVWAFVEGPLDTADGTFALDVEAAARDEALEAMVPAIRRAELELGADVMAHFRVRRNTAHKITYDGLANIETMRLLAPGAPAVVLEAPASIVVVNQDIRLESPARFVVGEKTVTLAGHYQTETKAIGANLQGEVALSVVRLFTDQVSAARGTASARALVSGRADRLRFDACVRPQAGAQIVPRALGREVTFRRGEICLRTEDDDDDEHVFRAKDFAAEVGEGSVVVNGSVDLRHLVSSDEKLSIERWDLDATGDQLEYRSGRNRVVVRFDLEMVGDKARPVLRGRVDVDEGEVRENFELKNFVLTKAPSAPSEPLAVQLAPYSLQDLHFNIALSVQDFRARADVATIRVDTTLRGDLRLTDSVRLPQLTGLLDVSEGYFIFPHATFEVEQTEVEFPPQADGKFRPNIFVQARADLESPKNGLDTEVSCVLAIDGNIDQARLSLETEDAEHQFGESTILRFILFGTPLSSGVNFQNGEAALRAVSTEVTAVLTRELEDSIRDQFGTQVQFNLFFEEGQVKGGVRYQLGERIKFEGETGVAVAGEAAATGAGGSNARLRLLLIDHFPVWWLGQDVAFEGEVNSGDGSQASQASSDLRLSYRLFEF